MRPANGGFHRESPPRREYHDRQERSVQYHQDDQETVRHIERQMKEIQEHHKELREQCKDIKEKSGEVKRTLEIIRDDVKKLRGEALRQAAIEERNSSLLWRAIDLNSHQIRRQPLTKSENEQENQEVKSLSSLLLISERDVNELLSLQEEHRQNRQVTNKSVKNQRMSLCSDLRRVQNGEEAKELIDQCTFQDFMGKCKKRGTDRYSPLDSEFNLT